MNKISILKDIFGSYFKTNDEYLFHCPFCKHHKRKLSVNIEKNVWKCWICDKSGRSLYPLLKKFGSRDQKNKWKELSNEINLSDDIIFEADTQKEDIIKVELPKTFISLTEKSISLNPARNFLISRGVEKGGSEEFVFKSISPKYIKGSGSFNPVEYSFDSSKLSKSFGKNIKTFENEYTSSYFAGVSKKIGNDFYLSRSGKITDMELNPTRNIGEMKLTREGLRIDASLKDWTLTKIIPKSSVKGSMEIDFTNTKSGLQGLQMPKQSSGSGLVTQSAIQEFKQSFVPKLMTKSSSISSRALGVGGKGLGLSSIQIGKTKSVYASGLSSSSLGLSSSFNTKTRLLTGLSSGTSFSQLQLSKTDLGLKQMSIQELTFGEVTPTPFGGFGYGFSGGFPPFALPSLGGGLGYVKRKVKGKRKKTKIKPSLTASLFDLRGSLPKGGSFGITPFQLRRIPKGSKNPYTTSF